VLPDVAAREFATYLCCPSAVGRRGPAAAGSKVGLLPASVSILRLELGLEGYPLVRIGVRLIDPDRGFFFSGVLPNATGRTSPCSRRAGRLDSTATNTLARQACHEADYCHHSTQQARSGESRADRSGGLSPDGDGLPGIRPPEGTD